MKILIAACSENRVIGENGRLPWSVPEDMQRFRALTWGNVLFMGRKTYEGIGHPLPGRITIVLSKTKSFDQPNVRTASTLQEALEMAEQQKRTIYICGGGEIYQQTMPLADKVELTLIYKIVQGDTFFPAVDQTVFKEIAREERPGDPDYTFITYERKGSSK